MYALARDATLPPASRWERFRQLRDALFAGHPCSPLAAGDRHDRTAVPYFPYDPASRVLATAEAAPGDPFEIHLREDGAFRLVRVAWLRFALRGRPLGLAVYRRLGYGGGLFVPFRDATAGGETYGGGRYLIDTVKHADLGTEDGLMVLDFNFAYHPSCAYSPRWDCPLAPPENRLEVRIEAGERLPRAGWRSAQT
ncbi:MAG TPA: DUF1684 domain-containing protein [Trueperaceae bacterium]|nr:DUF1684 domain-containing protein [Trueperaceae bacterium]